MTSSDDDAASVGHSSSEEKDGDDPMLTPRAPQRVYVVDPGGHGQEIQGGILYDGDGGEHEDRIARVEGQWGANSELGNNVSMGWRRL